MNVQESSRNHRYWFWLGNNISRHNVKARLRYHKHRNIYNNNNLLRSI